MFLRFVSLLHLLLNIHITFQISNENEHKICMSYFHTYDLDDIPSIQQIVLHNTAHLVAYTLQLMQSSISLKLMIL